MENTNYYYIQPSTTVASIGLIITIIVLFLFIIFKLLFISINWESEKCKNSNFFIAPLLGQDGETTFNQCTNDAMKSALNDTGTEYYNKISAVAFLIVGFSCGGFIMAYNISSFIKNADRFPFLASLRFPLMKFCLNTKMILVDYLLMKIPILS